MNKRSILVVDDEPDIRSLLQEILEDEGYDVSVAETAESARTAVREQTPDLVLLDIWMPDEDGVSLLKSWKQAGELQFSVIMISGHGTVETAVEATRHGAVDFIEKPVSLAKLLLTVDKALAEPIASDPSESGHSGRRLPQLVGDSQHMRDMREHLDHQSRNNENVLVTGEAGTGRALYAQHLHAMSSATTGRFIQLRCDGLSPVNAHRELFGHEDRGAVSTGYLESARNGTLFLADVEVMPATAQSALRQALEQQHFLRVGGSQRISAQMRIVSASRIDLSAEVDRGHFDASLLRLLSPVSFHIKPLREHREDISALLENFVNWHVEEEGLPYRHFTVAAQNRLRNRDWPGNLLELKNLVQRLLILGGPPEIEVIELDRILGLQSESVLNSTDTLELRHDLPLREARAHFERQYLLRCLSETQGNIGDLAKHVGMERTHLYRKLRSLDIDLDKVRE
ncbi:MAG: sigma-54 dependent transcriptional regulator [Gammaproteobacteria bacterium]|nr:sigma-54 dependent transcriptional regulator [Gammaproteobacteria bacterium]